MFINTRFIEVSTFIKLQLLFMCFRLRICSENRQRSYEVTCGR